MKMLHKELETVHLQHSETGSEDRFASAWGCLLLQRWNGAYGAVGFRAWIPYRVTHGAVPQKCREIFIR